MTDLALEGCRPVPLAFYLKALGVLRLVAEQKDPSVCGWWSGERFHLRTKLSRADLVRFFLEDYHPTPIIAPWNGGSGFYPGDKKDGIEAIKASDAGCARFADFREAIALGERLLHERALAERPADEAKMELIAAVRTEASTKVVAWIDAAVALGLGREGDAKLAFPPLLGTGGNDGRLDFTNNYMQRLAELELHQPSQSSASSTDQLGSALFSDPITALSKAPIGQFAPGSAGGPNSGVGFEGRASVNAWDFVLMLEGALVFAGGVSRRLEGADAAYLSYPFMVRAAAAGFGSASLDEQLDARGELWAPLWTRPANFIEVKTLFREGRLSVGARPARDGLDAARAIGGLAADRRITAFERYGFVKRQGLAYLAAPLGRRAVRPAAKAELLSDLDRDGWLSRLRGEAAAKEASADLRSLVRAIEESVFALLDRPAPLNVQSVLAGVGCAVLGLARRPKLREKLRPPPRLRDDWIEAAVDGSVEFRIALALAGLRAPPPKSPDNTQVEPPDAARRARTVDLAMCAHLAPLDPDSALSRPTWAAQSQKRKGEGEALAVWGAGALVDNLCAVARRRLVEQSRRGIDEALFDGCFDVDETDIAAFLDGATDDARIAELLLGLAWVKLPDGEMRTRLASKSEARPSPPSLPYAAMKPLFTPRHVFVWMKKQGRPEIPGLPIPSELPALLAAGRVVEALRLAQARARASGLPTPFLESRRQRERPPDLRSGRRLLAALIIPTRPRVVAACLDRAYPFSDEDSHNAD